MEGHCKGPPSALEERASHDPKREGHEDGVDGVDGGPAAERRTRRGRRRRHVRRRRHAVVAQELALGVQSVAGVAQLGVAGGEARPLATLHHAVRPLERRRPKR